MVFSPPKTDWIEGEVVQHTAFNTLNANIDWLKTHNAGYARSSSTITLSSSSYTTLLAGLEVTRTRRGGNWIALAMFNVAGSSSGFAVIEFDVQMGGVSQSLSSLVVSQRFPASQEQSICLFCPILTTVSGSSAVFRWVYRNTSTPNNPTINRAYVGFIEM